MTTRFRFGCIAAVCAVAVNVAVAQEAPPASSPPTAERAPPAAPPAGGQAEAPPQPRDNGEFIPSQELSADEAVTFPVDI